MSIKVMTDVWSYSRQKGSTLLLLLAVADFADDDGFAWPGIPTLAKKIRMSARQTVRLRQKLFDTGELRMIKEGGGRSNTDIIQVAVKGDKLSENDSEKGDKLSQKDDKLSTERVTSCPTNPDKLSERVTGCLEKGDILARKGDIAMSPDPSLDPPIEPKLASETDLTNSLADDAREPEPQTAPSASFRLLREAGIDAESARKYGAVYDYEDLLRAVAHWYLQRQDRGGKFENSPGMVMYWLRNPDKLDELPAVDEAFWYTPLGLKLSGGPPQPTQPLSESPPDPAPDADPWARIVNNYRLGDKAGHGSGLSEHLENSRLEAAGEVDGVPHYVIHAQTATAAHHIGRHIRNLRMDLGIELGVRRVLVTVAQPEELEAEQPVEAEVTA